MTKKLTLEQKEIVRHLNGHAIVKAVPGSGKTTTLIMRVSNLLKRNVKPENVLILMYNKAAQISFKEKLQIAISKSGFPTMPDVRTFHSYAQKLVKQGEILKIIQKKELVDQTHSSYKSVIKASYAHGNNTEVSYIDNNEIEQLELKISNWRLEEVAASDLESDPIYDDIDAKDKRAYSKYCELMNKYRLRTFDDLLIEAVYLIRNHNLKVPTLHHIVVDEYQDVNYIQNELIKCLTSHSTSVMVVGDVNQCIYEWRGSRPDFIEGIFQNHFKGAKIFNLSCTFRYGHLLASIANSVISKSKDTTPSICVSHPNNKNTEVYIHQNLELHYLIKELEKNQSIKSNVIIGRANADLIEPEIILLFLDIPYSINSGQSRLILRPEISLLTVLFCIAIDGSLLLIKSHTYFQIIVKNFLHQLHFRLAKGQLGKIVEQITNNKEHFWKTLIEQVDTENYNNVKILKSLEMINNVSSSTDSASTLFKLLNEQGLFQNVSEDSILRRESNDQSRGITYIQKLLSSFNITVEKLLQILVEPKTLEVGDKRYELSTMHASKGLEWDNVIIIGLHDKVYPGQSDALREEAFYKEAINSIVLKEERRLFYVAITRAKYQLHLLVPEDNQLKYWQDKGWSSTPKKKVDATRFVFEMDIKQSNALLGRINNNQTDSNVKLNANSKRYIKTLRKIH